VCDCETCNVPLLRCSTIALRVRNHVRRNGSRVISSPSRGAILAPAYTPPHCLVQTHRLPRATEKLLATSCVLHSVPSPHIHFVALWTLSRITQVRWKQNQSGFYWSETVSGSGISWVKCKYAPLPRQITMPAPHYRTGALPAAKRRASKHWRPFCTLSGLIN